MSTSNKFFDAIRKRLHLLERSLRLKHSQVTDIFLYGGMFTTSIPIRCLRFQERILINHSITEPRTSFQPSLPKLAARTANDSINDFEGFSRRQTVNFKEFHAAAKALQALEEYKLLLHQSEPDLLEGAVLIVQHQRPEADITTCRNILDDLAEQLVPRLPEVRYPLKLINTISEFLYKEKGFEGAFDNYYLAENSCMDYVLTERTGIPITLSLVYMEVAKRCGVELYGVNVPGHFFLTPADPTLEFFVDAFNGGSIAFLDEAEATLEKIYSRPVKLDPEFLRRKEQIPARIFFSRLLNNLKAIYGSKKEYSAALQIIRYLRATRPGDIEELREEGYALYHLQRYDECQAVLTQYVESVPEDAEEAPKARQILDMLREGRVFDDE